jgi:hypothetical protein
MSEARYLYHVWWGSGKSVTYSVIPRTVTVVIPARGAWVVEDLQTGQWLVVAAGSLGDHEYYPDRDTATVAAMHR